MSETGVIAVVLSIFVAAPSAVFFFVLALKKSSRSLEELRYKKEMLELELAKEELKYKALLEENKKYDRLIDQSGTSG